MRHIKYNIEDEEFWNFSWDEHASKDLPSMLYYVLNQTNIHQLFYIGHSQGTMVK